ncbi:MAG: class I SAM-dependent methyltransferase [Neisseriaceae bacterium]|nr:class I SAM-dependent methyltransferase [Neisseriaceae bacterium]
MIEHDNLEEYQDPHNYDLEFGGETEKYAFFLTLAQHHPGPILELACGTGLTALPIAEAGFEVTGIDLSPAMLAHAQKKAAHLPVKLYHGNALHLSLLLQQQRYTLIYLTGNAFQCFLTHHDQVQLLQGIRTHLAAGGVFAFETRNPSGTDLSPITEAEPWGHFTNHQGDEVSVCGTQQYDDATDIMHWTTIRRWGNHVHHTRTACKFTQPVALTQLLANNGFSVIAQYGHWDQRPLHADSPLIISVCQLSEPPTPVQPI